MASKRIIQLTDIQLHTREHAPTQSFERASRKADAQGGIGRIYGAPPETNKLDIDQKTGEFEFTIPIPPDLKKELESGRAVLELPKGGLNVYLGKDAVETAQQLNRKERRNRQFKKHKTKTLRSR